MRVAVVGLGYVGLVTAAGLAEWGHEILGIEASPARLGHLKSGQVPFFEPELDALVAEHTETRRLVFDADARHVSSAQVAIVAVGTHDGNGGWQTDTIRACLEDLVPRLADDAVLVIRSTLPPEFLPGLGALVAGLRSAAGRQPVPVIINPEFTREGAAVHDFLEPDRVVIGVVRDATGSGVHAMRSLYRTVTAPVLVVPAADAALAKLGSNLFLATKISFANELATLCDVFGADVASVVEAMSHDPRIGGSFLRAGVGFGGSCLPHQVTMTIRSAAQRSVEVPLLEAVDRVNHGQRTAFVNRLADELGGLAGRRIALLGLTFKPSTDDLRDAPALTIARALLEAGATVAAFDPMPTARAAVARMLPGIEVVDDVEHALDGADAVGLVTEWQAFRELDWVRVRALVRGDVVIDGRNTLDPDAVAAAGFRYLGFGRRASASRPEQMARPAPTGLGRVAWPAAAALD
jgi:UDPglucose 6-dehydrogenase